MTPVCFGRIISLVRLAMLATLPSSEAYAQRITVDGRLSPAQTLAGPNYAIGAGLGRQVGGNLFHSFGAFGLRLGETATFSGPSSAGNVIGRVTGGTASSIDGGIKSTIPGANLYLVNPAGVVFGPNASVDVSGSFHASSADYLRMKDGARFQATNPDASTLSAAPPDAFGFLSANQQPVTVNRSNLQLAPHNTLGLVGGPVTISGGVLYAPGGTVHIASAAGPGEVPVDPRAGPPPTVARSGRVQVANKASILASGENGGRGGSVFIRAGELSVSASDIGADNGGPGPGGVLSLHGDRAVTLSNGATVRADANGAGRGADVGIGTAAGGSVTLDSASVRTVAFAAGDSGAVAINTGALLLQNGALVLSQAQKRGNGGPISVVADSVLLDGTRTAFSSTTFGTGLAGAVGAGGRISLTGGTLSIQNGASIKADSFGSGPGGPISVAMTGNMAVATGSQILSGSNASGASGPAVAAKGGDAGSITLNAGALSLVRGGSIRSVASASGNAGEVALNVGGALTIDAANNNGFVNGVSSETTQNSSGSASTVRVNAGSVSVLNGGFINGNTHGTGAGGSVVVATPGALLLDDGGVGGGNTEIGASALGLQSGNAGTVTVSAGKVTVQNGALIDSTTVGPGRGGSVVVTTPGALLFDGQGAAAFFLTGIEAQASGTQSGNAGTVTVSAGSIIIQGGAQITSSTDGPGRGGDVTVNTGSISILNGGIVSSDTGGTGSAGSVQVATPGALLLDGRRGAAASTSTGILAQALGVQSGNAGTITVRAGSVSILNGGVISSGNEGAGSAGPVQVTTPGVLLLDGRRAPSIFTGITAVTTGARSGNAGAVTVRAGTATIQGGAQITSSTDGPGRGGDVTINTSALLLDGQGLGGTAISAETLGPGPRSGDAGTVTINAGSIAVQGRARISSSTAGAGGGGDVTVNTGALTVSGGGNVGRIRQRGQCRVERRKRSHRRRSPGWPFHQWREQRSQARKLRRGRHGHDQRWQRVGAEWRLHQQQRGGHGPGRLGDDHDAGRADAGRSGPGRRSGRGLGIGNPAAVRQRRFGDGQSWQRVGPQQRRDHQQHAGHGPGRLGAGDHAGGAAARRPGRSQHRDLG